MEYMIEARSDVGIQKKMNEDSLLVKMVHTELGNVVFAVICDGMGGLKKGEVASATLVEAFDDWFMQSIPETIYYDDFETRLQDEWNQLLSEYNQLLINYSAQHAVQMGTTITALLLYRNQYYIVNVGDSRAYRINKKVSQLTKDHSLVAREVEEGRLSIEEAKNDKRKNILLQCIGVNSYVKPDFYVGDVKEEDRYLLCSDGFRHKITNQEILEALSIEHVQSQEEMGNVLKYLIDTNKERLERDNISAILIKVIK